MGEAVVEISPPFRGPAVAGSFYPRRWREQEGGQIRASARGGAHEDCRRGAAKRRRHHRGGPLGSAGKRRGSAGKRRVATTAARDSGRWSLCPTTPRPTRLSQSCGRTSTAAATTPS